MMQRYSNKQLKLSLLVAFMFAVMALSAQMDMETESGIHEQDVAIENDNYRYFRDIVLERGLYMAMINKPNSELSDGRITSLYGSYFIKHWLGFRSGASLIMDLKDDSPYLKVPCLIAVRTPRIRIELHDAETFSEYLTNLFLLFIPARFECNLGPSFGYVWNNRPAFAFSIDGNLRMGFQFWRIGLHGNMGFNYLWTKNFKGQESFGLRKYVRPYWYANMSFGMSFRM
jgi:hypothetical protein